jgi:hypothetical protein
MLHAESCLAARRGVPSGGQLCSAPFRSEVSHSKLLPFRNKGRRSCKYYTRCETALLSEVVSVAEPSLQLVSSTIQSGTAALSSVAPGFLQPTISTVGSDLADVLALQPSLEGTLRLGVSGA